MKSKIRKISIDNQVFVWNYTEKYYSLGDFYISRLFFSPQGKKYMSVECFFKTRSSYYMGCHLNHGFSAIKDEKEYSINFNTPQFVSDFIRFMITYKIDFDKQQRYKFDYAHVLLEEMGFHSRSASFPPYELFLNE